MDLTPRKERILSSVVAGYVKSGEPVGSKAVAEEVGVSSATVRNEMADLIELGLLEQPHTSAGRVPSQKGYREYVDRLMEVPPVKEEERRVFDSMLLSGSYEPEQLLGRAARLLAGATRCAAVATTPSGDTAQVRAVPVTDESGYDAAFSLLAAEENVALVLCDSTDVTVQQKLRDSVSSASEARRERIAVVCGGTEESVEDLVQRAGQLNSERVVLGLTGGTGAGKSSALRAVESLGGQVIDCDQLYHEMLETCAPLRDDIGASFPGAFDADGQLDRRKLGQEVFSHKDRLEQLNSIIFRHLVPEVRRRLASSENRLFAIDAINLLEGGLDQLCDRTVAVTSPLELRVRRIMARDNITEQYARLRISAQQPDEYYRSKCDCELNNAADTAEEFQQEAREFFQRLIDTIKEEKAHGKE